MYSSSAVVGLIVFDTFIILPYDTISIFPH